jgi:hypothetical protein
MEGLNKVGVLIMVWRMMWKIYGPCTFHDYKAAALPNEYMEACSQTNNEMGLF